MSFWANYLDGRALSRVSFSGEICVQGYVPGFDGPGNGQLHHTNVVKDREAALGWRVH